MYSIVPYNTTHFKQWNDFVARSKNGSFLFDRNFMGYHANRFTDASLLIYDGPKLIALLPANIANNVVYSHQGLTYGGLVLIEDLGVQNVELIFFELLRYLHTEQISLLKIKQLVSFYHKQPSFELEYILYKFDARRYNRDMNLAIDFRGKFAISKSKLKHFRRIQTLGLEIKQDNDFDNFWDTVLVPRLMNRYSAKPVHSKNEIKLLHSKFPNNILQFNVYYEGEIVAGITLFVFDNVIKSQYGATTATGEKLRALDYLFINLIQQYKDVKHFFDMGTVNQGKIYNQGLLKQKEELGCSVYLQDFYEVATENYRLMDSLI